MASVVIIGAGLTGLSTAYHLEQLGFYDYTLFEKEPDVGGLCRSIHHEGFVFDYTGHLLHINAPPFKEFIENKIGLEHFNTIHRRSFIYSHDRYTRYPYQTNLFGLPSDVIAACIEGFVNRPSSARQPTMFTDWVMHNFGAGCAEHFFFPYQKKIFDFPIEKLSASWTGRFVPQTSLRELIMGAVEDRGDAPVGYNAQFLYPKKGGIVFWIELLASFLHNTINTNKTMVAVDLINKKITFADGSTVFYDTLINTMPLKEFLQLINNPISEQLPAAAERLLCNNVINFNIGVRRPELSDKHWVYFPEEQYPFYRIGFWHNFGDAMAPPGCSSLYGEISFLGHDPNVKKERLTQAKRRVKQLFNITTSEIATECDIAIPHAYVIFDSWRDKHLPKILKKLEDYNVFSVGRYGAWKYSSMQEGFLEGKEVAENVVRRSNLCTTINSPTVKSSSPVAPASSVHT